MTCFKNIYVRSEVIIIHPVIRHTAILINNGRFLITKKFASNEINMSMITN